ncbi:MAG: hypothetical protein HYZ88_01115 [Candidatus Omnitrophica bacterium]|nr:hypothetical protein [Candidatus Omnitrophota bacterium]
MTQIQKLIKGAVGGLVGGLAFGLLMGMMGMLPMVAKLVGSGSAVIGFGVHLVISAVIGATYGLFVADRWAGLLGGAGYGLLWWFLGPLTLMPFFMGMGFGTHWTLAVAVKMLPSLMGHLIYGVILAATYHRVAAGPSCGCR